MKLRAFTLFELTIVLAIMTVVLVPLGYLAMDGYRSFAVLSIQASSKAECQRAAETVFRLAAANGGYEVEKDHHGLRFRDGSRVHWTGDRLELVQGGKARSLLKEKVLDFTAVRRGAILTLNLQVESKRQVRLHEIYDYPRVGLP